MSKRLLSALLFGGALLASSAPAPAQGAWIKEWSNRDCSGATSNIGNVPNDGSCVPYCPGGSCWGSQKLTCSSAGAVLERFVGDACSGTKVAHANDTTLSAPATLATCLQTMVGSGTFFSVACDEEREEVAAEQATRAATRFYAGAACEQELYGPVYSNEALGACTKQGEGRSSASYCEADGSGIQSYQFASDDCAADSWTAIAHEVGSTSAQGSCVATWSGDRTVYSKHFCPTGAEEQRGKAPPQSWPPAGAAPAFKCATADCSAQCTQRIANRLGHCQSFDENGLYQRQVCTPDGLNRGVAVSADAQCKGEIVLAMLTPASQTCNGKGEYNSCPYTNELSDLARLPRLQGIWHAEFAKPGCKQADYAKASFIRPGVCLYGHQSYQLQGVEGADGRIEQLYIDSTEGPCVGGSNYTTNSWVVGECTPAPEGEHAYASHSYTADGYTAPPGSFELPYSDKPNNPNPPAGGTGGNVDNGGSTSTATNGGGEDNGGGDNNGGGDGGASQSSSTGSDGGGIIGGGDDGALNSTSSSSSSSTGEELPTPNDDGLQLDGAAPGLRSAAAPAVVAALVAGLLVTML